MTEMIHGGEVILRDRQAARRRLGIPFDRAHIVLWHAKAFLVQIAYIVLSHWVARARGLAVPS